MCEAFCANLASLVGMENCRKEEVDVAVGEKVRRERGKSRDQTLRNFLSPNSVATPTHNSCPTSTPLCLSYPLLKIGEIIYQREVSVDVLFGLVDMAGNPCQRCLNL